MWPFHVLLICRSGSNRAGDCGWARRCPAVQAVQPAQVLSPHYQVFGNYCSERSPSMSNSIINNWWYKWLPVDLSLICSWSSSIVGTGAVSLLITIEEMHVLSKKMFFNSLSLHASKLMDKVSFTDKNHKATVDSLPKPSPSERRYKQNYF